MVIADKNPALAGFFINYFSQNSFARIFSDDDGGQIVQRQKSSSLMHSLNLVVGATNASVHRPLPGAG
jgi:hypothetical protein